MDGMFPENAETLTLPRSVDDQIVLLLECAKNKVRNRPIGAREDAMDNAQGDIEDLIQSALTRFRDALREDEADAGERVAASWPQRYARL